MEIFKTHLGYIKYKYMKTENKFMDVVKEDMRVEECRGFIVKSKKILIKRD